MGVMDNQEQELDVDLQKARFKFKGGMSDRKIARMLSVMRDCAKKRARQSRSAIEKYVYGLSL